MMVAALLPTVPPLPLLLPPDRPEGGATRTYGWRWRHGRRRQDGPRLAVLERRPQDDPQGAVVQWMVVRYYRDGVQRKALAQEYGYSERRVQEYLSGTTRTNTRGHWWLAYAAPVLRALTRLGFPVSEHSNRRKHAAAQIAACRRALAGVADLLADDDRPAARRLRGDVRLLTLEVDDGQR